jgi:winged helix DNA-binding protein
VPDVLNLAELNRATLARQMLLARGKTTVLAAVEQIGGLQAQLARPPFLGLWSRVSGFRAEDLVRLAARRRVVRATAMRATLHLLSAKDYRALRPALQPMLTEAMKGVLGARAAGFDLARVTQSARRCLDARPMTFDELRAALAREWPGADERAMGYAVRTALPLVQVPDETTWGWPGAACFAVAETWLGKPIPAAAKAEPLVLRYLGAFGPAGVKDAQAWSGLRALGDAFEALRPKLRVFRDDKGRELFDLPRAPRPPASAPAPVRFLPDYDSLMLAHADRRRVVADEHRPKLATKNLRILASYLVDGFIRGTWRVERARRSAALVLEPFEDVPRTARAALLEEGAALLRFAEPDAEAFEVRLAP